MLAGGIRLSEFQLVNIWTDPEPGPGGFNPMLPSLLWAPDDYRSGDAAPAFVYVHGWGGYPYDRLPTRLGPELADQGFVFLSVCMRRRGMEGQLLAMPDHDMRDIKLAVDYLHTNGCSRIFLLGDAMGGLSVLRYMARHKDSRVAGLAIANPQDSPAEELRSSLGDERYAEVLRQAGLAARQGAGTDVRIDLFPSGLPAVTQNALAFLAWWSPMADTRIERNLEDVRAPLLLIAKNAALPAEFIQRQSGSPTCQLLEKDPETVSADLANWAAHHAASMRQRAPLEWLEVESAGRRLFGLLWSPADGVPTDAITVLVHGLTSSPLSALLTRIAPELAHSRTAVLAVELRRSGWAGHESSVLDNDMEDLDRWLDLLLQRGYTRISLAGTSIGSISVGRYQSLRQHPNVVAVAHLMPTAECPDWFRKAAGNEAYAEAARQAKDAVAAGLGAVTLIDVDIRQPPPNKYGGRFRWTQRAASWLSWFGPEADSRNIVHIANARVPLLLLSGTEDSYNDTARFAELRSAAVNAPRVDEIWYPDIDHGLAGVERQVGLDLHDWLLRVGAI